MPHANRLGGIFNMQPAVYGDEQIAYLGGSTASVHPTDHPPQVALDAVTHPEPFNLWDHLYNELLLNTLAPATQPLMIQSGLTANGQQPYEWF